MEIAGERGTDGAGWPAPEAWHAALLAGGAALLAWSQVTGGRLAGILSYADLVFHEAGHVVFGLFGWRFLTILGGTLGQLAFPVAAAIRFGLTRQTAPYAAMVVWLGVNLVDVGTYAADGNARLLPLITMDPDTHDWWHLLGMLGIREHAEVVGGAIRAVGWALWGAAPAWLVAQWAAARRVLA